MTSLCVHDRGRIGTLDRAEADRRVDRASAPRRDRQLVPGLDDVTGHRESHGPEPDESDPHPRPTASRTDGAITDLDATSAPPYGDARVRDEPMSVDARLAELRLTLPGPYPPHDPLDAVVIHGGVARTSGQLPATPRASSCIRAASATG